MAPWPTDPSKGLELNEKMWAAIDANMKRGLIRDYGIFPDGISGYIIVEGETADVYRGASTFVPYILSEVHEIIPYEKQKEVIRALFKAQIEAAKR